MSSRAVNFTSGGQPPQCHVHQGSSDVISMELPKDACTPMAAPPAVPLAEERVFLVEPRCGDDEVELEVLCVVWSSAAEQAKVSWLLNGKEMRPPGGKDGDGARSRLKIRRESWDKGDVYTCKVTRAAGRGAVMRNSSKCTACVGTRVPPQLYLTQPSYADLVAGAGTASVTCLLLGWHLEGTTLTWDEEWKGTTRDITRHPNGTHSLLLSHRISLEEWLSGGRLRCRATVPCHRDVTLEIHLGPSPSTQKPPKATVTRVPGGATQGDLLLCDVTDFTPRDIVLQWTGGRDLQARTETGPVTGREVFSVLSVLRLDVGEEGKDYVCVVHHPTLQEPRHVSEATSSPTVPPTPETQEKSSPPHGYPKCPPSSLQPPSFHELFRGRAANLTCATALANATVGWARDGQPADPEAVKTQAGGAMGTRSWLRVSLRDWNETANFSCRVRGGAGETQLEINRRTGPLKPPSLHLLPSSPGEACAGRDFTLFCLVKDFYPPEIAVWWRRGLNEGPADEAPSCDHRARRCSLVVALEVPWGEWVGGTSYTCLAAHISTGAVAEETVTIHTDPWDCAGLRPVPCGLLGEGDDLEPEEDGSAWTTISTFVVLFLLLIFYSGFVTFIKVK